MVSSCMQDDVNDNHIDNDNDYGKENDNDNLNGKDDDNGDYVVDDDDNNSDNKS